MGGQRILSKAEFDLLIRYLRSQSRPSANERKSPLQWKVYKSLCKNQFALRHVFDPRSKNASGIEERLVVSSSNKIVVHAEEVEGLITTFSNRSKGANAKTLYGLLSKHFAGVDERLIQTHISATREAQSLHPKFLNKAPLQPIIASKVQERNQLDLVDLSDIPVEVEPDGLTYKYVLSILDVFSR